MGRYPGALATVAVVMGLLGLVPGLPFLPFVAGAAALAALAYLGQCRAAAAAAAPPPTEDESPAPRNAMGDVLDLDDIHLEFAPDLVPMVLDPASGLDARIGNMRTHVASAFGLILPEIRLTDDAALPPGTYVIRIQGLSLIHI